MARASTPTILPLDRYAKIMGLSPVHFNGATVPTVPEIFPYGNCDSVWFQYDWQSFDQVSREQLAMDINQAEEELARNVGYYAAPVWISAEEHPYPRTWFRDGYGLTGANVRYMYKSIRTNFARITAAGRRATTVIQAAAPVVYSDPNTDGFEETATITVATTITDECEIKVYFAGYGADPIWEVRPVRSITIAGGFATIVVDSWLLINPTLWEAYPTSNGPAAIDISATTNYVTTVDVYREYNDTTQASSTFYWTPYAVPCPACFGTGCESCARSTQTGCLSLTEPVTGVVMPVPATYDTTDAIWEEVQWTDCREPDSVRIWYRAGDVDQRFHGGLSCDELSPFWAQTIAYLASARLDRPVCTCNSATQAAFESLREDLSHNVTGSSYFNTEDIINNPFGTRRGEVIAWRRVSKFVRRRLGVAVI